MQVAWPVVEAAFKAGCHYLDTTGEQDWMRAIADKYGAEFATGACCWLPPRPSCGRRARWPPRSCWRIPEIDSLDILYQVDNGLPSEASTRSFLRMVCNDTSQYYLEQNKYKA